MHRISLPFLRFEMDGIFEEKGNEQHQGNSHTGSRNENTMADADRNLPVEGL